MTSTFFGFTVANSGLSASQVALNTTSHNVSSANVEGYSRQRLMVKTERPDVFPSAPGVVGRGINMENIEQIRDEFLDFKLRRELNKKGEYNVLSHSYKTVMSIFNEPSDSGIRSVMDEFYLALNELSKNPDSLTVRALVRQRSIELHESIKKLSISLENEQKNLNYEVGVVVEQINGYAKQVARLNKSIYKIEIDGKKANDLRDERNLILDKLSEIVNVNYYEDSNGRFYVDLNGNSLVSHYDYDQIEVEVREERKNEYDVDGLYHLKWDTGATFSTHSGKLRSILDMRDNIDGERKGMPYYIHKLNDFIDTITTELNMIHQNGYNLHGDTNIMMFTKNNMTTEEYEDYLLKKGYNGKPGLDVTQSVIQGTSNDNTYEENKNIIRENINLILKNNPTYKTKSIKFVKGKYLVVDKLEAKEVTISRDIEEDLSKISAAFEPEGPPGDENNAHRMIRMRHNKLLFDWGSPEDFLKSLVSNLGVDGQDANRNLRNEELLVKQIDYDRQSIMGVSLDEEMTNMIKFQHSYNACARMINVFDEMIDLVVNRLGTVGR